MLIVSEPVLAEIFPAFRGQDELQEFLLRTGVRFEPSTLEALERAGAAWSRYRDERGTDFLCQNCGATQPLSCSRCSSTVKTRQHLMTDFLIGAHAVTQADRLMTRDRGYFSTYFPDLNII